MRPILFRWQGMAIQSYPAMLYVGLVLGVAVGNCAAHRAGLDSTRVFAATLLLLVPALVGARLAYVAGHWGFYRRHPRLIWKRSEGGAAMYGGLPLSLTLSVPLLRAFHLPFLAFWDVATFTILVGMLCTRIGCLLNGCCAGRPTRSLLGWRLPNHRAEWQRRIPTQLLEAAWTLILLVGAPLVWGAVPFPGALFLYLLGGYGLGRLVLESYRERTQAAGGLNAQHAISAGLVSVSLAGFVMAWPW